MKQFFFKFLIISSVCLATAACSSKGNTHEAETEAAETAETPAAEEAAENEMETIDSVSNQ